MMDYATLVAQLEAWQEEDGAEFTASVDTIIDLAEQRISKELDCDAMRAQTTLTLVAGTATVAKPALAVGVNWVRIGSNPPIQFRDLTFMLDFAPDATATGTPRYYGNKDADTLYFAPTPNTAAAALTTTCEYFFRITGLSSDTTTTWISVNAFDLLFYACLVESGVFLKNAEDGKRYGDLYARALETAKAEVARVRSDATSIAR